MNGLFASRSLAEHLLRGAAAFALLWWAIAHQYTHMGWSLGAGLLAIVALRGCPVCWAIGLAETVRQRRVEGS